MKRNTVLAAAGLVAVVALGWIATRIESTTVKQPVGASGEARRNPFLAAQRLVARMGFTAREMKSPLEFDQLPPRAVLLLPNRRQALTTEQHTRVLGWVSRGGHLIFEAESVGVSDPLADALGVRRERVDAKPAAKTGPVTLPHAPAPFEVRGLGSRLRLVAPSAGVRARVETLWGPQLLQLDRGAGLVTVATDLAFAENPLLGAADNADFLWQLVRSLPATRELLVFNRIERLSLWQWLIEHVLPVLVSGAALLALWLWRIGPRFGPVAADLPPARRRLLDHLRASGRFYWKNEGRARLVEAAREACLARVARAQPGFASLQPGERIALLVGFAGVSQAEATRLLEPGDVQRGAEFIALMRTLQHVHARLDHGTGRK
jgi:hypothetical protein